MFTGCSSSGHPRGEAARGLVPRGRFTMDLASTAAAAQPRPEELIDPRNGRAACEASNVCCVNVLGRFPAALRCPESGEAPDVSAAPRGSASAPCHPGPRAEVPPRAAGRRAQGRHRRGDPRPPGRDRGGGDRVGEDDPAAEDLPRGRPRADRAHRAHPAPADRCTVGGRAHRRGARGRARRRDRLPGALHRPEQRRHPGQGDDRRHPAQRDATRPAAAQVRHDHHRRGARATHSGAPSTSATP